MPPQGSYEEIMNYAKKKNVNYLIADVQVINNRPQLEVLYTPLFEPEKEFVPPPGIELLYKGQEPGGIPYLVYRLKSWKETGNR